MTGISQEVLEEELTPLVVAFLQDRGVDLSANQSGIIQIQDGFDF
jgi:RNA-directed DNA polymerase